MYRRLKSNFGKVKDATFTAAVEMKKGMLVQKDFVNDEAILPAALAATNLYIVDFDPEYTGFLAVENYVSDYDARLNDIALDAKVTLELLEVGEEYATDQFVAAGITKGGFLEVNTDGKLQAISVLTSSPLVCTDVAYDDAGNTLLAFTVTENAYA